MRSAHILHRPRPSEAGCEPPKPKADAVPYECLAGILPELQPVETKTASAFTAPSQDSV